MKKKAYIETTVVSYLTGQPSRSMVIASHQELTRQWWDTRASGFDVVVSELAGGPIPRESAADALHISIAAVNGIDFLLTWNCKHLANAAHRQKIEALVEAAGYICPVICTPEELLGE